MATIKIEYTELQMRCKLSAWGWTEKEHNYFSVMRGLCKPKIKFLYFKNSRELLGLHEAFEQELSERLLKLL